MKVVVDTNLLISGFLWRGGPGRLIDAAAAGPATLTVTEVLLAELARVVNRPKFAARLALRQRTPAEIVAITRAMAEFVFPVPGPLSVALRDPQDEAVLRCALAGHVDAIITGDNDLLVLKSFERIPILTVAQALAKLGVK